MRPAGPAVPQRSGTPGDAFLFAPPE